MIARPNKPHWPELPLMRDETVVETGVDRNELTRRYTDEALSFIDAHRERPFFLFLSHAMPGSTDHPFAGEAFRGRSEAGPYGDAVEEMDHATGRILEKLEESGLDAHTLVITTSDHGPIPGDPPQGSAGPLGGAPYTTSEWGMRVPCVVRWPGRVSAGVDGAEVGSVMDLMPTFARLAGTEPPADRAIDGHDLTPLLERRAGARSGYDETGLMCYHLSQLQAVRCGRWKLYLPLEEKLTALREDRPGDACSLALYDLRADPGETRERSAEQSDLVQHLLALAEHARHDIGDRGRQGPRQRPAGWMDDPAPLRPREEKGA
jgi:arylsulfatase A-like enzyme